METMGDRLKLARERAGYSSARQAAIRNAWGVSTYSAHENGQNDFDEQAALLYGRKFKVSPGWLLTGEGSPSRENAVFVRGLVSAGGTIDTAAEQIPNEGYLYEIEVPFPVPEGVSAFEITGDSMLPRYDPGDVILCGSPVDDLKQLVGREAVVRTAEGGRYLKRLQPGSRQGLYDLESLNLTARPIRGVRLQWGSAVLQVVRASQWRKVEQASGRAATAKTK